MAYYKHYIYGNVKYTYDCIFTLVANPLKHLCYFSVLSLSTLSDVEEYKYKIYLLKYLNYLLIYCTLPLLPAV